jgi:coproporphyrinogen III oxidase-like Fe-S oxidoreductase
MAHFPTVKLRGMHNEELLIHMCRPVDADMVEFHIAGGSPVIFNKEQFDSMVAWVNQQFEILGKEVRTVH